MQQARLRRVTLQGFDNGTFINPIDVEGDNGRVERFVLKYVGQILVAYGDVGRSLVSTVQDGRHGALFATHTAALAFACGGPALGLKNELLLGHRDFLWNRSRCAGRVLRW